MTKQRVFFLPLLLALLLSACTNNDPIQARRDLLGPGDYGKVRSTTLIPLASDTSLGIIANTGLSPYLLAGEYGGTETKFLLRFSGITGTVKKAQLVLPIHIFTGAGNSYRPSLHRVTATWQEDSVTAAKFNEQYAPATVGTPLAVALDSLRKNSDKDTLWFNVDSTLVQSWIADSTNNFGLLVKHEEGNLLTEYHSRHSAVKAPRLKLVLTQSSGRDTTRFFAPTSDAFVFTRKITLPTSERLYIGNGEQFRPYLAFAPLDSIPAKATINYAELQFTIDTTLSIIDQDGLAFETYALDSIFTKSPLTYKTGTLVSSGTGIIYPADRTLRIPYTLFVQDWLVRPEKNLGFIMESLSPTRNVLRVALFADRNHAATAPRLLVDYTEPPK